MAAALVPVALWIVAAGTLAAAESRQYELPAEQRTGSIRRVLVLPHSHLDIGFTLPPDQVARDYKDNIDTAIRLVHANPDFRWTIESAWMLGEWLRRTSDEHLVAELASMLRDGRIALGAAFANMHSGLMGAEEINRLVYLGEYFRRRFGIRAEVAFQNDVPGFSWAYPRVLAGSGVKYLVTGLNLFIGGGNNFGVSHTPFYWVGPDGSRVLTWFTYESYVEGSRWKLTSQFPIEETERTIPRRLAWLEHNGYPYDTYLLMHSAGDNADPMNSYRVLLRIREWNLRHPELPLKMCTAEEFFAYLTGKYGERFMEARGDASGHWELVKLGAPEVASRMREAAELLPAAEGLATIASLMKRSIFPKYDVADAWKELLVFHEHTAGGGPGWPGYFSRWQTDWSNAEHYAAAMSGYSNSRQLFEKAVARLAGSTGIFDPAQKSSEPQATVLVYNGLSWPRGGPVEVTRLPAPLRDGPLEILDRVTGQVLPCEDLPDTHRIIRFFSPPVPAMGYRLYTVRRSAARRAPAASFSVDVKWNDQGWITSIRDIASGMEMVDASSARPFGSLLVASNGGDYRLESGSAVAPAVSEGPVAHRIEIPRRNSPLRRTLVTLYPRVAYADLAFEVDLRQPLADSSRFAIALPVAGSGPLWLEGAGFVYQAPRDLLPGGEAPQYTPLHFAHFGRNAASGVTVANRDAFLMKPDGLFLLASQSLLARTRDEGTQHLDRTEPRGSGVQTFRFRLAVQGANAVDWQKFGQEFNLPLEALVIPATDLAPERSFLAVNHPAVRIAAFKPAEYLPDWYVIRLQEMGGEVARNIAITAPFRASEAVTANTVETPWGTTADISRITLNPWQTLTLLVRFAR